MAEGMRILRELKVWLPMVWAYLEREEELGVRV
jgi:hypothetical protein